MLNDQMLYLIYWDNYAQNTYLYGSTFRTREDGSVYFENERMPSGFPIKTWSSRTNYQRDRFEPQLPLLVEEERYRVKVCMKADPEGSVLLRVEFFNRQNERISYQFLEGEDCTFEVPKGTWYYRLELVQSGSRRLVFYGILLCADSPALRGHLEQWTRDNFLERAANIRRRRMFWVQEERLMRRRSNE